MTKARLYTIGSQSRTYREWQKILGKLHHNDTIKFRIDKQGMSFIEAITTPLNTNRARNVIHSLSYHPLYQTWLGMHYRCYNPHQKSYKYYGAKGVTVCWEWHQDNKEGLQNFIDDMYPTYKKGYQLDKDIRAKAGQPKVYSKDTCCWVTNVENSRKANAKLTVIQVKEIKNRLANGLETDTIIAKDYGVARKTINDIKIGKRWKAV